MIHNGITIVLSQRLELKLLKHSETCILIGNGYSSKFSWIANIAKPDIALAFFVGAITYFSMIMMPGSAEQTSTLLFIIPAIICIVTLINFPSAIGLYWATSSVTSLLQSLVLNKYYKNQETCKAV